MNSVVVLMAVYGGDCPNLLSRSINSIFSSKDCIVKIVLYVDGPLPKELRGVLSGLASNQNIRIINGIKNMGLAHALNQAIKHALDIYPTDQFFARMDADDFCHPLRFQTQIDFFEKNMDVGVLGSQVRYIDSNMNPYTQTHFPCEHKSIAQQLDFKCPINHPTVMFRRSVVEQVKYGVDTALCEDLELWFNLREKGVIFSNVDQPLLDYTFSFEDLAKKRSIAKAKSEYLIRVKYCARKKRGAKKLIYFGYLVAFFISRVLPSRVVMPLYYVKNRF